MIYISTRKKTLRLHIPLNGNAPDPGAALSMDAKNTTDHETVAFALNSWQIWGDYIVAVVRRPDALHAGEWDYSLIQDGPNTVISRGLLVVDKVPPRPVEEYNEEINYIQYGE